MDTIIREATEAAERPVQRTENNLDQELEELLKKQRQSIKVVGCGGGGNNTINRFG